MSSPDTADGWRKKRHNGFVPPPGYVEPYRARHKSLTSTLRNDEHDSFKARAQAEGITPTELATKVLREYLAANPRAPLQPDDFDKSGMLVYEDANA